jgi:hypothetical protein
MLTLNNKALARPRSALRSLHGVIHHDCETSIVMPAALRILVT